MFAKRKAVLEMPADAAAAAGGGALGYAGFWARLAALLVDTAILMIIAIVLTVAAMAMGEAGASIANIVWFLVSLLYWPVLESSARQATFGKMLLGIQVTDLEGNRVSFVRALLRNLAKILSAIPLYIGFLLAAFTGRKQALHDMITGCLVVRAGPSNFLKMVVVPIVGLLIVIGGSYYYFLYVYLPQKMESAMKGVGKEMERAMKEAMREAQKGAPSVKAAPKPLVAKAPEPAAAPKPPAAAPSAPPAPAAEKPAAVALAPAKPAAVEIKPVPEKPAAAPAMKVAPSRPAPEAAPSAEGKPKAKRRAAPRKPAAPAVVAAPPAPPRTPKYNDVMTAVMNRDRAGAAEAIEMGFWVDRADSNGVTPLMAAAMNGDAAMTELLLKHGANPNRSGPGGSVLAYAGRGGDGKVVALLKKAGAR